MAANSNQIVVDLTNYKDRFGTRVPEGRYLVSVSDAEPDQSKAGNKMVNIWFDIISGPHKGATIVDRLVLSEKSMFRVVNFLRAIGLPTPKKKLALNLSQFVGKVLEIDVADGEPYNGNVKSEVKGYLLTEKASTARNDDEDSDEDDLEEDLVEEEEEVISEDPTDYDEDEEPAKVKAAAKKRAAAKQKAQQEELVSDEDDDLEEIDLDDLEDM